MERPTPSSWYQVAWSGEVANGRAIPVEAFGEQYVLARSADGEPYMLDAFCPHMGAHLGHGGVVTDKGVECPFHGWVWDKHGQVAEIPYSSRINRSRELGVVTVREVGGIVFAWYDDDRKPPAWDDPMAPVPEYESDAYYPIWPHSVRAEEFPGHPQLVVENAVDAGHFVHVHRWDEYPQVEVVGADGHRYRTATRTTLKTKRGPVEQVVDVCVSGIGVVVTRHRFGFDEPNGDAPHGEVTVICTTPTSRDRSVMRMTTYVPREKGDSGAVPSGRAALLLRAGHREVFENDWEIWANMRYEPQPAYTIEEARTFPNLRKWADQFYPDRDS